MFICKLVLMAKQYKKLGYTAEIARDADDVEKAIQGHSTSSVVVPIDAAYMTSY